MLFRSISNMPFTSDILFSSPSSNEIVKISKAILQSFSKAILDTIDESQVMAIYEERSQAAQETENQDIYQDIYREFHQAKEPEKKESINLFFKLMDYYNRRKSEIRLFLILAVFVAAVFYALSNYKEFSQQKNQKFRRGFESLLK